MSSPLCPQDPSDPNVRYRHLLDRSALRADLKNRSMNAGLMVLGGQVGQVILKLVSITVLARLLTPDDYGLVGMAWVFAAFVSMFSDMGLSLATVQREHITHEQVSTLFWLNIAICAAVSAVIAALAPAAAWFYREPRVLPLMLAFAALPLVSGWGLQPGALLKRQMRQRALAGIRLGSTAVGVGVAITMAALGAGFWSLVGLEATQTVLATAGTLAAARWRPSLPRRGTGSRAMLRFGGALTVANLVSYWGRKGDDLLIGRFLGAYALGLYTRAYSLMCLPLQQIVWPMSSVIVPGLSAVAHDPARLKAYYLKMMVTVAAVTLPAMAFVAVMAKSVVQLLLGDSWLQAVPVVRILAIAGALQTVGSPLGLINIALHRPERAWRWNAVSAPITIAAFAIGLPWGLAGVATSYTLCTAVILIPAATIYQLSGSPVRPVDLLTCIAPIGLKAAVLAIFIGALDYILLNGKVAVVSLAWAALAALFLWMVLNRVFHESRSVFGDLHELPRYVKSYILRRRVSP